MEQQVAQERRFGLLCENPRRAVGIRQSAVEPGALEVDGGIAAILKCPNDIQVMVVDHICSIVNANRNDQHSNDDKTLCVH